MNTKYANSPVPECSLSLFQFLSQHHDLSFDMTGSLTSTLTHTHHHGHHQQLAIIGGLISNSGGTAVPPNAQSTPVSASSSSDMHHQQHLHHHQHHHSSLLTTPTLSSSNSTAVMTANISAHSTPKLAKFSPERQHHTRNSEAPRTPTPFKRALAEVYRGREPLSNTPQTPTKRVEDITEIIKKDLEDLTDLSFNRSMEHQTLQDSGYGGTTDKRPHNVRSQDPEGGDKENSSPNKRGARKALASKWSTPAQWNHVQLF